MMELKNPDIRYLKNMEDVIYDKEWLKTAGNPELYYMYRGLKREEGLRYDITVIPSRMLGKEYVKTKGHEHIGDYGELYTVLGGEAIFFVQKGKDKIEDVYAVKAKKGDTAIIPPGYAHITINPSREDLKMANWMAEGVESDYSFIQEKEGACYYYTTEGWIKNKNYKEVPELYFKKPLKKVPKDLSFLK